MMDGSGPQREEERLAEKSKNSEETSDGRKASVNAILP